jgi:hypothetical protein
MSHTAEHFFKKLFNYYTPPLITNCDPQKFIKNQFCPVAKHERQLKQQKIANKNRIAELESIMKSDRLSRQNEIYYERCDNNNHRIEKYYPQHIPQYKNELPVSLDPAGTLWHKLYSAIYIT